MIFWKSMSDIANFIFKLSNVLKGHILEIYKWEGVPA